MHNSIRMYKLIHFLLQVHAKAEERAEEIQRYRRGLQEKVEDARPHAAQWGDQCSTTVW